MRSHYLSVAGHELHVVEWGDPAGRPLVMWHGLARTARDFDIAAAHFAGRGFRVVAPDTVGRGLSSWSKNPEQDYTIPAYAAHALGIMDQLGIERAAWVGTSMGGILGMAMAGTPQLAGRIERLVVNDAGPRLNTQAIERIKAYVSFVPEFDSVAQFEAALRVIYAPFGKLTDAEWRLMAETSLRRRDNGKISAHYDPAVMQVFADTFGEFDMWDIYDAITCPVLVLRGEASDLLEAPVAEEMTTRGPKAQLVTVPGCGHAPALNVPDQIAVLETFLV